MKINIVVVSAFQQNCRIVVCEKTNQGILIDPGDEPEKILNQVNALGVSLKFMVATHGHLDHVSAASPLQKQLKIPFYIHQSEQKILNHINDNAKFLLGKDVQTPIVDQYLEDGQILTFGECTAKVIHTPGHTPGNISLLIGKDLFCGDLVFAGGIGRTDLPGGSSDVLQQVLKEKIMTMPKDTVLHSGHGPSTTIEKEWENLQYWISL